LTLMNVFVVTGAILLISVTTFIIAFSPLRVYSRIFSTKLKKMQQKL
jgi:hypothetical protein